MDNTGQKSMYRLKCPNFKSGENHECVHLENAFKKLFHWEILTANLQSKVNSLVIQKTYSTTELYSMQLFSPLINNLSSN